MKLSKDNPNLSALPFTIFVRRGLTITKRKIHQLSVICFKEK